MTAAIRLMSGILTITEFELRKVFHDSSQVFVRAIQPLLWLVVFGGVFGRLRVLPTGSYSYLQFLTPGVLAQSVIFIAVFYGITLVWERDFGLLSKLLSTPVPHSSIILGKTLAAGARSILQAVLIFLLALAIGIPLHIDFVSVTGVVLVIVLSGMCFSSLSIFLASMLKTRERMMGIGQAITMPLFFASSAIYPLDLMPDWLKIVAIANPLSYTVDALRALLVTGDFSHLARDLGILTLATAILIFLATTSFKRIVD